jgi:hypothetical protein
MKLSVNNTSIYLTFLASTTAKKVLYWFENNDYALKITRSTSQIAVYMSEETPTKSIDLLMSKNVLSKFIDLVIITSEFGVIIRDPKTEVKVLLVDKWQCGCQWCQLISTIKINQFEWQTTNGHIFYLQTIKFQSI